MILVYIEHNSGQLTKASRVAAAAALKCKEIHAYDKAVGIIIGSAGTEDAAKAASKLGLDEVVYLQDEAAANYLGCSWANVISKVAGAEGAKAVISLSGTTGKDFMPRVAQSLAAAQASDVLEFLPGKQYRRPMYAGNVIADVELGTDVHVVTVRSTAFDPAEDSGECPVRAVTDATLEAQGQEFVSFDSVESERPELTEAEIVVSGGRALKSEENFAQLIEPLADKLGAAIGASRAAVDSGYAPNDWQVGQTGKVVAPKLYIAVGISGAIQHLAGMKDSKVIVAINKDGEAPIFEVADYGLVADLYDVLPELIEKL